MYNEYFDYCIQSMKEVQNISELAVVDYVCESFSTKTQHESFVNNADLGINFMRMLNRLNASIYLITFASFLITKGYLSEL